MSCHDAISHRLRRVYLPLLLGLLAIWLFRLAAYSGNDSWIEVAAIQTVPGTAVLGAVSLIYVGLIAIALWPSSENSKEEDARPSITAIWLDRAEPKSAPFGIAA